MPRIARVIVPGLPASCDAAQLSMVSRIGRVPRTPDANFAAIKGAAIDGFILVGQLAVNEAAVNLDLNGDGDKVDTVNQPCVVSTGTAGDTLSETAVNY